MPRLLVAPILIASTASASFWITPEQPVSDPAAAPPEAQHTPTAVLSDGERYVVFWTEAAGLSVTFVNGDGQVESQPRGVVPLSSLASSASACWTGSTYIVTWQDREAGASVLYAAVLSRDAKLVSAPRIIDRNVIRIGNIASDGRRALVAYRSSDAANVQAALFEADGAVIAAGVPLPIEHDPSEAVTPRAAGGDGEFGVMWTTANTVGTHAVRDFHFVRVAESGAIIGEPLVLGRSEQIGDFGVAFGGGRYAIAAIEQQILNTLLRQPRLVRFTIDPKSGVATQAPPVDVSGIRASVFWNGSRFIAYWMHFGLMTLPFGDNVPVSSLSGLPMATSPVLASNATNVFGAWSQAPTDTFSRGTNVVGALFDANAQPVAPGSAPAILSVSWSRQFTPSLATSATGSLVVWIEERASFAPGRLLGKRIGPSGVPLDRDPIEIAPVVLRLQPPLVTFTGRKYLVIWVEALTDRGTTTIVVRTVGIDGALGPRLLLDAGWDPAAASTATTTLVAFGTTRGHVAGFRLNANGEPIDRAPLLIGDGHLARVATNGTDFFVAWDVGTDYWQFPSPDYVDVFGARVMADGSVDAGPLPIATGKADQNLVAIGSDGRDYLVLFALSGRIDPKLAAKRVLREGQLAGTTSGDDGTIIGSIDIPFNASVAHDEKGYWIAWTDTTPREALMLVRTDASGNPDAPVTLASNPSTPPTASIALAQTASRSLQIAYARRETEGLFAGTTRVFFRFAGEVTGRFRPARH